MQEAALFECLRSFFELRFYKVLDIRIIFRHLTSYNVNAIIIGAADNVSFQCRMGRKGKILDQDRDISALAVSKDRFLGKECETVCADIIQFCMILLTSFLNGYNTMIGNVNSWVLPAVQDLRPGT